ncbi:uncharacterized protein LOC142323801 [Lycorma delicatula]|uniref:uncharacterized protein LOC142323801 n=1 Tax=Lycorma delicatula TaxID=130591 RepID=UPI003F50EBF0
MATVEEGSYVFKEECVFVDYLPINLREEEVTSVPEDEVTVQLSQNDETDVVLVKNEIGVHKTYMNNGSINNAELDGHENSELSDLEDSVNDKHKCINDKDDGSYKKFPEKVDDKEKQLKTHVCYHCSCLFLTHEKMLRHVKMYHKENVQVRIDREGKRCWVCGSCKKTFISRKGSIIHQRTHTGERPYTCTICSKRFIDSSTLMKHQVIHQAVRPFTCHICKRGFNQKVALQRHERTHSQQQIIYICKYCPKTFLGTSSLQAHEKIHSGIKPFSCKYCQSTFHTSTAQRQHERVHTNERPYSCLYCPKAFKDSGTLFKHQVIHSGIKPFVCPLCSQGFTQKVALKKHIRSHVMKSDIKSCDICKNIEFTTKDELCDHFEKHHVEDHPKLLEVRSVASSSLSSSVNKNTKSPSSLFSSPVPDSSDLTDLTTLCDVAISTAKNLTFTENYTIDNNGDISIVHAYKHHQYTCSECGMGFKRLKSLKSHLLGHSLMCKYCDKVYSDRSLLEEHEKLFCNSSSVCTNYISNNNKIGNTTRKRFSKFKSTVKIKSSGSNKRQFYCEKCDKYFSSRNGYMIHQRSHTGEKPYGCRWCDKAFGDSATRHKHERIHTGERPFKCDRCPRAFNQRAALRAHQITHSVDRAFVCPYCPSSFPYAATLKRHCDTCHNEHMNIICPICDDLLSGISNLHNHIKNKHVTDKQSSICPLCDSGTFTDLNEFSDHIIWHAKQLSSNNNSNKLLNKNSKNSQLDPISC